MRPGIGTIALSLALAAGAAAQAQDSGKSLTMVISSEPGGGYDLYGRLIARHIGNHLPGQPRLVVQNMPGAGGLVGANYLYNRAPRDGSTIGVVPETVAIGQLIDTASAKFDAREFLWLGRLNSNVGVQHVWTASGVRTIADAKSREVVVAGTGPASLSVIFPRLLNTLIGTRFKIVPGYTSATAATLAFERGEVDGVDTPWSVIKATKGDWLREARIAILVQYSVGVHPDLPAVPSVVDLAETAEQRQIFTLYASAGAIGRSIVAPPGLPAAAGAQLRAAFTSVLRDPALLQEAEKGRIELDPMDGAALQSLVASAFDISAATLERAKALTEVK